MNTLKTPKSIKLLFLVMLFFSFDIKYTEAQGSTELKGILKTDRTLTLDNSPYYIKDNFDVLRGATLTIEEGVVLEGTDMFKSSLNIYGKINVKSSDEKKVTFKNLTIQQDDSELDDTDLVLNNMIIKNLYIHSSGSSLNSKPYIIQLNNSMIEDSFITINTSDENNVSSLEMKHSIIQNSNIETNVNYALVKNNLFQKNENMDRSNVVRIWGKTNLNFESNKGESILEWNLWSEKNYDLSVKNNRFYGESKIILNKNSDNVTKPQVNISNNFFDTTYDYLYSQIIDMGAIELNFKNSYEPVDNIKIQNNAFKTENGSSIVVFDGADSLNIENNDFLETNKYFIENKTENNIKALSNFWGINPTEESIQEKNYDGNVKYGLGTVEYKPYFSKYVSNIDFISPNISIVDKVTDASTHVRGTGEVGALVTISKEGNVIGEGRIDTTGKYEVSIPGQKAGVTLSVTLTDAAGNRSGEATQTVMDVTAPAVPSMDKVTDASTYVRGTGEVRARVTISKEGNVIGEGRTDTTGKYEVSIPVQKAGVTLSVTLTDGAGNQSGETTQVVTDVTAPAIPSMDEVTDASAHVRGTGEVGAQVTISKEGNVIGEGRIDATGKYRVSIPVQKAGVTLSATLTDGAGNQSGETTQVVTDVTSPAIPSMDKVTDASTYVRGTGEVGAQVTISKERNVIGEGRIDATGKYEVSIPVQKAGVTLSATLTDGAGNQSGETTQVVMDVTAPTVPSMDEVTDASAHVRGTGEVGAQVTISKEGNVIGEGRIDATGKYRVSIPVQKAGVTLSVTLTDDAGNQSGETTQVVTDVTAPAVPSMDEVTDASTYVRGTGEVGAQVTISKEGNVIGEGRIDATGKYEASIPVQKAGVMISVTLTDAAGNRSGETTQIVTDVTPPLLIALNPVYDNSKVITGKAEINSIVYAEVNGKIIGKSTVTVNGFYSITIKNPLADTIVKVYALDLAGNISKYKLFKIIDKTSPVPPNVNVISDKSTVINGTVESNAKVYVMNDNKLIGTTMSKNGEYNLKISKLKAGIKLTIFAKDASGNTSKSKMVTVLDKTPPVIFKVNNITTDSNYVTGKTERNTIIIAYKIFNKKSEKLGEYNTRQSETYKIKVNKMKKNSMVKVYAKDVAGNISEPVIMKVK